MLFQKFFLDTCGYQQKIYIYFCLITGVFQGVGLPKSRASKSQETKEKISWASTQRWLLVPPISTLVPLANSGPRTWLRLWVFRVSAGSAIK